jgi:hypothetical protein
MRATIDPETSSIVVSATASLSPPAAVADTVISFFLNRELEIDGVEMDGVPVHFALDQGTDHDLFAPSGRRVSIAAPVEREEIAHLAVKYHGRITGGGRSISRISTGLTELNLYAAWFPLFEGPQGFDYEIDLTAPAGQTVVGNGALVTTQDPGAGHTLIRGRSAAGDLPLLLSPAMKDLPISLPGSCEMRIVAVDLPEGVASWIASEAAKACDLLETWPDPSRPRAARGPAPAGSPRAPLTIAIVPREGDGYARPPLAVIPAGWFTEEGIGGPSTPEAKDEILRRVFHEMAHLFAPLAATHTCDDWINEGLAEYLGREALAASGRREAVDRFVRSDLLELAKRSRSPSPRRPGEIAVLLAPISATLRTDPDAHLLYYVKGALIFRMLAGTMGRDSLGEALGGLRRDYPASSDRRLTTAELLKSLERTAGASFDWIRQDWIEGSGLPEISSDLRVEGIVAKPWSLTMGVGIHESGAGGGGSSLVSGSIRQMGPRFFHLVLPLVARRGGESVRTLARLSSPETAIDWPVPFKPSTVVIDPDLTVPRVDPTIEEALRLMEVATRSAALTHEGLAAEKEGRFQTAMERYGAAIDVEGDRVLPHYRRARVLLALGRYEAALAAHESIRRLAGEEARAMDRLRASVLPGAGAGEAPPPLWLPGDPDLRSWNEVRIGQIEEHLGSRGKARRAYRRALALPDLLGAHEEAARALASGSAAP